MRNVRASSVIVQQVGTCHDEASSLDFSFTYKACECLFGLLQKKNIISWNVKIREKTIDSIHLNSEACQVRQLTSSPFNRDMPNEHRPSLPSKAHYSNHAWNLLNAAQLKPKHWLFNNIFHVLTTSQIKCYCNCRCSCSSVWFTEAFLSSIAHSFV